jgi:hypothetical protein
MLSLLKRFFGKKQQQPLAYPHNRIRRIVDTNSIRARLKGQGWRLVELPIRKEQTVQQWKVIAVRGDQSVEMYGKTIDEAVSAIGKNLGVIPRN